MIEVWVYAQTLGNGCNINDMKGKAPHTCSHSFLEKQYTIPESFFEYVSRIKSAISSMTTFPTDDFSLTYTCNAWEIKITQVVTKENNVMV